MYIRAVHLKLTQCCKSARLQWKMQEMQVQSLGQEEQMAIHSSIFAWEIPWTEESGEL